MGSGVDAHESRYSGWLSGSGGGESDANGGGGSGVFSRREVFASGGGRACGSRLWTGGR